MSHEFLGVSVSVTSDVYEPAEDSELLAFHSRNLKGKILEIGTGSGLAAILNAKTNPSNPVFATDTSPTALECARKNAESNGARNILFVQSDLSSNIRGKFDAILFNPPYLPTSAEERISGPLNRAFDGGEDGRETLGRFLNEFQAHLAPRGTLILIQSSLNSPEKTLSSLQSQGFSASILEQRPFFFEIFYCISAQRIM